MRIIAGKWRGRRLMLPSQSTTRPTTDRVREALFSMVASRIISFMGKHVLDLFAGSGALGLEALSRGAEHVMFAEKNNNARRVLLQNIVSLGCSDSIMIINDAFALTHAEHPYDLIFLDPPYGNNLEHDLIPILLEYGYINNTTLIVLETQKTDIPEQLCALTCVDIRRYGNCGLSFWRHFN